jgi:hypothetical protein
VHAFSNGGGYVVEQLYKLYGLYQGQRELPPVRGIVFDSAPGYDGGEMGKRVLEEVLGTDAWYRRAGIRLLHGSQRLVARVMDSRRQEEYWKCMVDIGAWCPTLHLYSMDDPLCDPEKLYELVMAKVDRGMDVSHRCWDVSAHCGHYKLHKAEYEEAVSAFVARSFGVGGERLYSKL